MPFRKHLPKHLPNAFLKIFPICALLQASPHASLVGLHCRGNNCSNHPRDLFYDRRCRLWCCRHISWVWILLCQKVLLILMTNIFYQKIVHFSMINPGAPLVLALSSISGLLFTRPTRCFSKSHVLEKNSVFLLMVISIVRCWTL